MKVDPDRIALVRTCTENLDNGLAPLIAAGLVHPEIARIVCANLRTSILESAGATAQAWMVFPRTGAAIETLDQPTDPDSICPKPS